jgi:formylglycine-generating enzyme required for sulfatase activity
LVFGFIHTIPLQAQTIQNQRIIKETDHFKINYNLLSDEPVNIKAFYTDSSGQQQEINTNIRGDIGLYIKPGSNKKILWHPADTNQFNFSTKISLKSSPFIEMVHVEGGTFQMGCTDEQIKCDGDEKHVHKVRLSSFSIGKYEITNAQYSVFLNEIGADPIGTYKRDDYIHITKPSCQIDYEDGKFIPRPGKENHPVIEVTWYGAQAFCEWAGGSLPTEAQWEFAARGGNKSRGYIYSGSNDVHEVAWFDKNSRGKLYKTGLKKPNELGIFDMSGNVWEWCYDWHDYYPRRQVTDPQGPNRGYGKVIRGGSWLYYSRFCRVANRGSSSPNYCFNNYGFRIVQQNP